MVVGSGSDQLVLLAAPAGLLGGIRDALQDWSAVGFVEPFCWLEDPSADPSGRTGAVQVVDGRSTYATVEAILAARDYSRIRLCVLVPAFADATVLSVAAEDRLSQLVRASRGHAEVERLRITVFRPGRGPGAGRPAREGWHNLVLSPEDSRGPGRGHAQLESSSDPIEIGSFAASTICGLTGLWAGIGDAPLDGRQLLPGSHTRVARSFFRRLDAEQVEKSVQASVLSMTGDLPRPIVGGEQAVTIENVALATTTMAGQFWSKHRDVLASPREVSRGVEPVPISVGRALKMLGGFLLAAIKGAPRAWAQELLRRAASSVATSVQATVLGRAPSAYAVVVRGVRADGTRASWADVTAATTELSELVADPRDQGAHHAQLGLPRVWRDYVAAAFTLTDAGERSPDLPPVLIGVKRGVLSRASDCAPGPDTDFTEVPLALRDGLGVDRIEPADYLRVAEVRERLVQAQGDRVVGLDAGRTLGALGEWSRTHENAFTVIAGTRLGQQVITLRDEVRTLLAALDVSGDAESDRELERRQRRLARWMRGLLIGLLVVLVGLGVVGGLEVLTWGEVAGWAGGAIGVWLIATFVLFLRGQRDFFAELHRREKARSQAEVNRVNLGRALSDLRRTTSAYAQHLAWSRVLGAVLAQPFGEQSHVRPAATLSREGLPLSMALGRAAPQDAVLATTRAQVRRDTYRSGWLTAPWERLLADAPARLGPDASELDDDPTQLYALSGRADSLLCRWIESVRTEGPGSAPGEAFWSSTSGLGPQLADRLIETVDVDGLPTTREAFMSGVDTQTRSGGSFDGHLFTPAARTRQADEVAEHWSRSVRNGLGVTAVLVELSAGLPTYDLEGLEVVDEDTSPPVPGEGSVF